MKYAVIDTESNGLFDFAKPADAEGQPRMASLAIITIDGEAMQEHEFLVCPEGWEMTQDATAVNGYTTDFLKANGKPVKEALEFYAGLIDAGYIVAAFNAQFDTKVCRGEFRRAGMPDRFETTPNICLMRACVDVCQVPKKTGKGFKFPKLAEACAFFKIEQPAQHNALVDARSAASILVALQKLGKLPAPEVHFAKVRPTA